jgi:hypothetical protein
VFVHRKLNRNTDIICRLKPLRFPVVHLERPHVPTFASGITPLAFPILKYTPYNQVSINMSNISCITFLWTDCSVEFIYTHSNRSLRQYLSWLPQTQILKHLPDFHETRHEICATQSLFKTVIFSSLESHTKTGWTHELARWDTILSVGSGQHTTAHPTAHLLPHWPSSRGDWAGLG